MARLSRGVVSLIDRYLVEVKAKHNDFIIAQFEISSPTPSSRFRYSLPASACWVCSGGGGSGSLPVAKTVWRWMSVRASAEIGCQRVSGIESLAEGKVGTSSQGCNINASRVAGGIACWVIIPVATIRSEPNLLAS